MIFTKTSQIPPLKYDLIMADPPWTFETYGASPDKAAPYDLMDLSDIARMEASRFASRDCVLILWAINPMLPQALHVLNAWGFNFVTAGHWSKRTKNGKLHFGTGYCLRGAGEPFLIGSVGRPKFAKTVRSVLDAKIGEHSEKPDEAFEMAERLVPSAVHRLELFSRRERNGWDAFGNEVKPLAA